MESKGAKINRPNIEPFRAAVQPVYAKAKEAYDRTSTSSWPRRQRFEKPCPPSSYTGAMRCPEIASAARGSGRGDRARPRRRRIPRGCTLRSQSQRPAGDDRRDA